MGIGSPHGNRCPAVKEENVAYHRSMARGGSQARPWRRDWTGGGRARETTSTPSSPHPSPPCPNVPVPLSLPFSSTDRWDNSLRGWTRHVSSGFGTVEGDSLQGQYARQAKREGRGKEALMVVSCCCYYTTTTQFPSLN